VFLVSMLVAKTLLLCLEMLILRPGFQDWLRDHAADDFGWFRV